jgi:nucleotide-binding universal stress UspA family protein
MTPTFVVGVEDSFRAQDAIALAGDLARPAGAEVLAVSAFDFDDRPTEHYNLALREPLREAAELTLERLCDPLVDLPHRRLAVADPSPARALLQTASAVDAALIVIGSSHGRFTGRVAPGSTGRRLLAGTPCAVALAPQGHRMRPHLTWGRVTAAVDGSPSSHAALSVAATLAEATGRMLRVVRVFPEEPAQRPWLHTAPGFLRVMPDAADAAEAELRRAVEALPAEAGFMIGDPGAELARESEVADVIVIGSRAYAPAGTVGLGDTGEQLLRTAACPVVIVPNAPRSALADAFPAGRAALIPSAG